MPLFDSEARLGGFLLCAEAVHGAAGGASDDEEEEVTFRGREIECDDLEEQIAGLRPRRFAKKHLRCVIAASLGISLLLTGGAVMLASSSVRRSSATHGLASEGLSGKWLWDLFAHGSSMPTDHSAHSHSVADDQDASEAREHGAHYGHASSHDHSFSPDYPHAEQFEPPATSSQPVQEERRGDQSLSNGLDSSPDPLGEVEPAKASERPPWDPVEMTPEEEDEREPERPSGDEYGHEYDHEYVRDHHHINRDDHADHADHADLADHADHAAHAPSSDTNAVLPSLCPNSEVRRKGCLIGGAPDEQCCAPIGQGGCADGSPMTFGRICSDAGDMTTCCPKPGTSLKPDDKTLFCFVVAQVKLEGALVKDHFWKKQSIYACEDHAVYTDYDLDPVPSTKLGDFKSKMGAWGSWLNVPIFQKAWDDVIAKGHWQKAAYTVKADADTVWFPPRLRMHLSGVKCLDPVMLRNTGPAYLGPLEVFSNGAIKLFSQKRNSGVCTWDYGQSGEDGWIYACMQHVGVKEKWDGTLLLSKRNPDACGDPSFVSIHPFKDVGVFKACYDAASR